VCNLTPEAWLAHREILIISTKVGELGRVVRLLTEYLERAVQLENQAASEPDPTFREQLFEQAKSYRQLAASRAQQYGLPPPGDTVEIAGRY
jgi:predicted nuclease of restriction endonuclease-like RecB superfamily